MWSNIRSWGAAQWWRIRVVVGVGLHVLESLARTLAWTLTPRRRGPVLALLEGNAVARVGLRNRYHARLYNPSGSDHPIRLHFRGWRDDDYHPAFELVCEVRVRARA